MGSDHAPGARRRLMDLRNGLLRLHHTLMESERAFYEREIARIRSSGQLLDLLLHDPWFAWLRELSGLVAEIDETLDHHGPANGHDAERLIRQARALLRPAEAGAGFEKRYFEAMQRDPAVILAHAEMRKLLSSLQQR